MVRADASRDMDGQMKASFLKLPANNELAAVAEAFSQLLFFRSCQLVCSTNIFHFDGTAFRFMNSFGKLHAAIVLITWRWKLCQTFLFVKMGLRGVRTITAASKEVVLQPPGHFRAVICILTFAQCLNKHWHRQTKAIWGLFGKKFTKTKQEAKQLWLVLRILLLVDQLMFAWWR